MLPVDIPAGRDGAAPVVTGRRARVLLVDRQVVFAESLGERLAVEPDLDVVGAVARPQRALALVSAVGVNLVILNRELDDTDGLDLARHLQALANPPILLFLSDDVPAPAVVEMLRVGASGWVGKNASVEELLAALRAALDGGMWLPQASLGPVLQLLLRAEPATEAGPLGALTAREVDVLRCMINGHDQAAIAKHLFMSPNTVRTHRRRTLSKLGVHSSLEAVAVARKAGLIGWPA